MIYQEPLFLQPVMKERIWGGRALGEKFGYPLPSDQTGECWGISAHPNGACEIKNGRLAGATLQEVYEKHRELFGGDPHEDFPLLTKILDAERDLSVQVHPDDIYARGVEGEPYGKTECWYVIDAEPGAEIVYGHHAKTREEFKELAERGKWDELLRRVKVSAGDFFYVPSGTLHAIGGGIMILETQQSSDITYRVYDYDRRDQEGNLRELHLAPSIEVTRAPHMDPDLEQPVLYESENGRIKELVSEKNFTVWHMAVVSKIEIAKPAPYLLVSILEGDGALKTEQSEWKLGKGDHLIIPADLNDFSFEGAIEAIISYPAFE